VVRTVAEKPALSKAGREFELSLMSPTCRGARPGITLLHDDDYTEVYEMTSWRAVGSQRVAVRMRLAGHIWTTDVEIGSDRLHEVWRRIR